MSPPSCLILLSGGLDSSLLLAMAKAQGENPVALSFDYGQRHKVELDYAQAMAHYYATPFYLQTISLPAGCNPLVGDHGDGGGRWITSHPPLTSAGLATTYVPMRNTLFLTYAMVWAIQLAIPQIWFGANRDDQEPYPDCRPSFFAHFSALSRQTAAPASREIAIVTPLLSWNKQQIVEEAVRLQVPVEKSWSCYAPSVEGHPCSCCLACASRERALKLVGEASYL